MAGILFVTWDGGGNLPPALAVAHELAHRGENPRFLGHASQRSAIESAGFAFEAYRHAREWSALTRHSTLRAPLAYAGVFTDRGMGQDLLESLQREPADRVVVDGLLIGAMHGLASAGVEYQVLVHSLRSVMMRTLTGGPLALIMKVRRLDPAKHYRTAQGEIVTTLASFDPGSSEAPPTATYTGPVIPVVESAARPSTPPVVLVSFSTTYIQGQREVLQHVLDALADLEVHAIVTTGPAVAVDDLRATSNAEIHSFVPHSELMQRASLVIGHGGHSTTMLALAHGVPLLVIPMNLGFDQPEIGRIVAERGVGLTLDRRTGTARLREAIETLLDSSRFREQAELVGTELRARRGAREAASVVLANPAALRKR
ncbi:MAG: glycosyltransferase family 1 protein [Salinibacterium sp.]|nr:glycosyltransferase family 1 protein [Salinibacterium sp.]